MGQRSEEGVGRDCGVEGRASEVRVAAVGAEREVGKGTETEVAQGGGMGAGRDGETESGKEVGRVICERSGVVGPVAVRVVRVDADGLARGGNENVAFGQVVGDRGRRDDGERYDGERQNGGSEGVRGRGWSNVEDERTGEHMHGLGRLVEE